MKEHGWFETQLDHVVNKFLDYRGISVPKTDAGIPIITARNVRFGYLELTNLEYIAEKDYSNWMSRGMPKHNDVILTTEAPLGNVALYPIGKYVLGQRTITIQPKPEKLDSVYLKYWFLSQVGQEQLDLRSSGSTAKGIKSSELKKLKLLLPPLPEQCRIAAILSQWDDSLSVLTKLIEAKRQQKRGLAEQLLMGKRRLKGFEREWEATTLGDQLSQIVGGGTPSRGRQDYWTKEGIPWITVKDMRQSVILDSEEHITEAGLKESASNLIPAGTIIMSTRMAVGRTVICKADAAINQDLKALFPRSTLDNSFLSSFLKAIEGQLNDLGTGSTVKGIRLELLKAFPLLLPPLPEQCAIASILSTLDEEVTTLNALKAKVQEQKRGLMDLLLTAKVRVKVDELQGIG